MDNISLKEEPGLVCSGKFALVKFNHKTVCLKLFFVSDQHSILLLEIWNYFNVEVVLFVYCCI